MIRVFIIWLMLCCHALAQVGQIPAWPPRTPAPTSATLTYTPTDVSQAWNNTPGSGVFLNANIGPVAIDRIVTLTLGLRSNLAANGRPSAVTLTNGATTVTLTNGTGTTGESTGGQNNYVFWLLCNASNFNFTTANIAIVTPFTSEYSVSVGNVNGSATASISGTGGSSWSQALDPRGVPNDFAALTIPTGGLVVVGGMGDRNTIVWTANAGSATVDLSNPNSGGGGFTSLQAHGTNGSPSFNNANNFFAGFVAAVFQP